MKFILRLHQALQGWEQQAMAQLLQHPCFRVNQKNHRIHVYAGQEVTLKRLHPKRGKEAMEAINIIPRYGGALIHDCWSSYLSYAHCDHGLCGSHLLRELTLIVDANGYCWAKMLGEEDEVVITGGV